MAKARKTNHRIPAPEGRQTIAQDVSPGWISKKGTKSRQGRQKIMEAGTAPKYELLEGHDF